MGLEKFGIKNRLMVYKDPWLLRTECSLVTRVQSMFETGYLRSIHPAVHDSCVHGPNDLTPRRSVMSRFARKAIVTNNTQP